MDGNSEFSKRRECSPTIPSDDTNDTSPTSSNEETECQFVHAGEESAATPEDIVAATPEDTPVGTEAKPTQSLPVLRALLETPSANPSSSIEQSDTAMLDENLTSTGEVSMDMEESNLATNPIIVSPNVATTSQIHSIPSSSTSTTQPHFACLEKPGPSSMEVVPVMPKKITQRRDQTEFETGANGNRTHDSTEDEGISSDSDVIVVLEANGASRDRWNNTRKPESISSVDSFASPSRLAMSQANIVDITLGGDVEVELGASGSVQPTEPAEASTPMQSSSEDTASSTESSDATTKTPTVLSPPPHPEEANMEMIETSPTVQESRRRKLSPDETSPSKRQKKHTDDEETTSTEASSATKSDDSDDTTEIIVIEESSTEAGNDDVQSGTARTISLLPSSSGQSSTCIPSGSPQEAIEHEDSSN